jgi:hypothetical protein
MTEDLTKEVPDADSDKLSLILKIVKRIESHETILTQIISRLDHHGTILAQILDRLGKLTSRVDSVETRLGVVDGRLDEIEMRLGSLEQTVRRSVHELGRGQTVLNDVILKIHIGFRDIDDRLQGFEPQQKPTNSST